MTLRWQTAVLTPNAGVLAPTWNARLLDPLSAPVVADGLVLVTDVHRGTVVALDATSGVIAWRQTVGSRINGPPTLWQGLCLFGSHDGWLYALRSRDGVLAWRSRIAPLERHMVAFGAVESVWPTGGPVLVSNDTVYAVAGRATETDGGLALMALDARTGTQRWATQVQSKLGRQSDLLRLDDGKLALHHLRFDLASGAMTELVLDKRLGNLGLEGWQDSLWTRLTSKRSGHLVFGRVTAELFAWDARHLFGYDLAQRSLFALAMERTSGTAAVLKREYDWYDRRRDFQPEALVRGRNGLLAAGTLWDFDLNGPRRGVLRLLSGETGKNQAEANLSAPPAYNGIAVARGRVYVALQDGSLVCFGDP